MSAIAQIQRCVKHQLPPNEAMYIIQSLRAAQTESLRPNLFLITGMRCVAECLNDCEGHTGMILPILTVRAA